MDSIKALLFGMTLAITIGPIALLIMSTALSQGYRAGFSCALAVTMADFTFALVAFVGASFLVPLLQAHQYVLQVVAAISLMLFALWMAYGVLRHGEVKAAELQRQQRQFLTTFMLTIVNPLTVLAFASFAVQLTGSPDFSHALVLALSAAIGSGLISVLMVTGAAWLGKVVVASDRLKVLNLLSAFGIFSFGAWGVLRVIGH